MSEQIFTAAQVQQGVQIFNTVLQRALLTPNANYSHQRRKNAYGGGMGPGGMRDYYTVLQWHEELDFAEYQMLYERGGMAGQIVDLPATDSWANPPQISEDDNTDTEFVKAWNELEERLHIWEVLRRADQLSGIGRYGALVFGLAGDVPLVEPVEAGSVKGPEQLLWIRPFSEAGAKIARMDEDPSSPRCGYPLEYNIQLTEKVQERIHYSRILHLAEHRMDSEIFARPRLKRSFNSVSDLIYKVMGGSAETFWLNQRTGMHVTPKDGYDLDLSDTDVKSDLTNQFEAWANDLVRILIDEGLDVQNIGGASIPDPSNMFTVLLDDIAAETRIPKRVLLGSAAGQLAAAKEDRKQWAAHIAGRQATYCSPRVLRPLIDRWIWYGVLPQPKDGYEIGEADRDGNRSWPSILVPDDEEQATISMRKATAAKQTADPATGQTVLTDKELRVALGQPADVPDDMVDDEPEDESQARYAGPSEPEPEPEEETVTEPEQPGAEIETPESVGEPDEETEQSRTNALFTASHKPTIVTSVCPLCGFTQAESYEGHGPLLRCAECRKTYDPTVEGVGGMPILVQEDNNADT